MGTPYQGLIQDLKVTIHNSSLVFPSQETLKKSFFLSNIDQVLNFDVQTLHFFQAHQDFPFQNVVKILKNALATILVGYDFLAGRLKPNSNTGKLEIDVNASGIGFVVASSEYRLDEIGDLVYPNPAFRHLIVTCLDITPHDDKPLCIFQLTSFKCGGFAMGISNNHTTFDGLSFKIFLDNLAAVAAGKPLAITPFNNRQLLAARSPPQITFPHPELIKRNPVQESDSPILECAKQNLEFKIFRLSSDDVTHLKNRAKNGRFSSFNVVTAHLWRCKALSSDNSSENPDGLSTILYAVDIRRRLNPPLPVSYTGNAVLTAYATASYRELRDGLFSRVVEMVLEGSRRITDEYARSVIDWGEIYEGFPKGDFLVSSWWKLGFSEVEYPWGKAKYCCPVVYQRKEIVLLFPDVDGGSKDGVNVLVALPSEEMNMFKSLFYQLWV